MRRSHRKLRSEGRIYNRLMAAIPTVVHPRTLFSVLDFLGIGIASAGGALHARQHRRYDYDIIGAFGLALASGLGGGIARDVLLRPAPPLALVNVGSLYTALGGPAIALSFPSSFGARMQRAMMLIDAAAISLFAVART